MELRNCLLSALAGLLLGALLTGAAWYGTALAGRAAITQALLATARCDAAGLVTITFADRSEFTCVPKAEAPPASRAEVGRRRPGR